MHKLIRAGVISVALFIIIWGGVAAQSVTLSTEEQEYVDAILVIAQSYTEASDLLATQFTNLGSNISLLIDSEWRMNTIIGLALYKHAALSTYELTPPAKFKNIHVVLLTIADEAVAAVDDLAYGMDNIDTLSMKSGSTHVIKVGTLMSEVTGLVQTFINEEAKTTIAPTQIPTVALTPTPIVTTRSEVTTTDSSNGIINRSANLRGGPGTNYAIVGSAKAGDNVEIIGQNSDGSWLKVAGDKWIAAFLVNQGESSLPTVAITPAPTQPAASAPPQPAAPAPTATATAIVEQKITYWGDADVQTCGNFEWRVSNVRRTKDTWYYDRNQVAQGEYLLIYVEVKNISGGTASFWSTQPTMPGKAIAERASQYGAWMMTGGFNTLWKDDVAPGEFLTLVGAFDVAPDTHTYLFGAIECKQLVAIGSWFELERGAVKAGN